MHGFLDRFARCSRGASSAEYALMLGLITVALIGGATAIGTAINGRLDAASVTIAP